MTDARAEELVRRWAAAWVHHRRLRTERVDGLLLVHVGAASRRTEVLAVDRGTARLAPLLEHVRGDPRAMLTVFGRDLSHLPLDVPAGVRVDRVDEVLMGTVLDGRTPPAPPPDLAARWELDGSRARYTLETDGAVAAEGSVGVLGTDAVVDRVETADAHRRRGLGRHVVTALLAWAGAEGARTGLLAATAEGRHLYAALGWSVELQMRSWMGTDDGSGTGT